MTAGDERRDGRYMLCAVSNTGRYGGGVLIAPEASADDGLLDVCLIAHASRVRLLRILPAAYRGEHVRAREVEMLRAAAVEHHDGPPAADRRRRRIGRNYPGPDLRRARRPAALSEIAARSTGHGARSTGLSRQDS